MRAFFSLLILAGILAGCAEYHEVQDPNDGGNDKLKAQPVLLDR